MPPLPRTGAVVPLAMQGRTAKRNSSSTYKREQSAGMIFRSRHHKEEATTSPTNTDFNDLVIARESQRCVENTLLKLKE
eukprot:scaffold14497_cov119-Cylindrotheca_fusiformis.AAC.10